mgnify:CR=1 FL=1
MYPIKTILDSGIRKAPDMGALAAVRANAAAVMLWNYHDDDQTRLTGPVNLEIANIPAKTVTVTRYLIDDTHSNSYTVWKDMGSPQHPTAGQIAQLEEAGQLMTEGRPKKMTVHAGGIRLGSDLKGQAVELIKINW